MLVHPSVTPSLSRLLRKKYLTWGFIGVVYILSIQANLMWKNTFFPSARFGDGGRWTTIYRQKKKKKKKKKKIQMISLWTILCHVCGRWWTHSQVPITPSLFHTTSGRDAVENTVTHIHTDMCCMYVCVYNERIWLISENGIFRAHKMCSSSYSTSCS